MFGNDRGYGHVAYWREL